MFYPPDDELAHLLKRNWTNMLCINDTFSIFGNYHAPTARLLEIAVLPCNPTKRSTCKPKEEAHEFMRDKYIWMLYNKVSFMSNSFGDETLQRSSHLEWIHFNPEIPTTNIYSL
jgi:hypothetical protein